MSATTEDPILLTHEPNGVSRLTFNRPNQRNAMNVAARSGIIRALDECRERSTKVIVLTGNGPAFCAGVDLKEGDGATTGDSELDERSTWNAVQEEIRRHPAIVIAAVNGFALGGGSTLINVSDLAIATEDAQIGMPEMGFGTYPSLAGPAAQMRVTRKRAAWLILTTHRITGATAADWGMVNAAVPGERLQEEVTALAERVAGFDGTALTYSKRALWTIPDEISDWTAAIDYGIEVTRQITEASGALDAGLASFREGRRNEGQGASA